MQKETALPWSRSQERNPELKKVDYIIVGQGIAGTFLSWFLLKGGRTFIVVDAEKSNSASRVAAGIIHPVTGRRIVKTWMADTFIPFAEEAYRDIENFFGADFFEPIQILELLSSVKEYNDWMTRSEEGDLDGYLQPGDPGELYDQYLQPFFRKIGIQQSARIHLQALLASFRNYFRENEILLEEKFEHAHLQMKTGGVAYKDLEASKIIFCEGTEALQNPFWKQLPFIPAKGETITIKADMKLQHILNRGIYILPEGEMRFRVGSTYDWNFEDERPTDEGKNFLVKKLQTILKIPFEVLNHQAALRPTVKKRRPFLGTHPDHPQVGIFNGLGTKGCLLAPWFAGHLAGYLSDENELMDEVDVKRILR